MSICDIAVLVNADRKICNLDLKKCNQERLEVLLKNIIAHAEITLEQIKKA